jgi:hypothetical protein
MWHCSMSEFARYFYDCSWEDLREGILHSRWLIWMLHCIFGRKVTVNRLLRALALARLSLGSHNGSLLESAEQRLWSDC